MGKWETTRERAWKDTKDWLLTHIIAWFLAFVLSGGGTMLATWLIPANVSVQLFALYGFIGGLLGLVVLFVVIYLTELNLAPKRQRDEARAEVERGQNELNQIKNARPNIVVLGIENVKTPIRNLRTREILGEPVFTQVLFANDPLTPLQAVDATNVTGHIDIYDQKEKHIFNMIGRWSETKEEASGGQPTEMEQITIAPNRRPCPMDIALKYQEDEKGYGHNNESRRRAPIDWRDENKQLPIGNYSVRIRLQGNNVDTICRFTFVNKGIGNDIESGDPTISPSVPDKVGSQT